MKVASGNKRNVAYQLLENAGVEFSFRDPTVPQLLVTHLEALPVFAELGEAGFVNVFDAAGILLVSLPLSVEI